MAHRHARGLALASPRFGLRWARPLRAPGPPPLLDGNEMCIDRIRIDVGDLAFVRRVEETLTFRVRACLPCPLFPPPAGCATGAAVGGGRLGPRPGGRSVP